MGFDIGYHPVDGDLITSRIIPYVRGESSIDDLVVDAVRIERVRHRSKQWALACLTAANRAPKHKRRLLSWLFGRRPPRHVEFEFDSELHVWGRPLFVVGETPEEVSVTIGSYLACSPDDVDMIVQEQVERLDSGFFSGVRPESDEEVLSDAQILNDIRWKLDLFREAFQALDSGQKVRDPEGTEHDPAQLFATDFEFSAVEFTARFCPGWMAQGRVWPTLMLEKAGVPFEFDSFAIMFNSFSEVAPFLAESPKPTIESNFEVGGYVPASRIGELQSHLRNNGERIRSILSGEGWTQEEFIVLRKLDEAVADAQRRHIGFVEVSDIYSGFLGKLN